MESSLDMQYRSIQKDRCLSTTLSLILGKHTSLSFSFTHTSIYPLYTTIKTFRALRSPLFYSSFNFYFQLLHCLSPFFIVLCYKQTNKHPAKQAKYVFRFFATFLYLTPNPSRDIFYAPFYKISYSALPSCIPSILSICFILPKSYFLFSVCLSLIIVC